MSASTPSPDDFPPFSVGLGYDVHRFTGGRRLVLGGVEIPYNRGLEGHSDADVLIHAIMDAMLGAAGLPDIGNIFPNNDERYRNANSRDLLRQVSKRIDEAGWKLGNVDGTIVAEAPKVAPHVQAMKRNLAEDLGVAPARVGVKATTNEGMGFVGRAEGIAALATVLLIRKASRS